MLSDTDMINQQFKVLFDAQRPICVDHLLVSLGNTRDARVQIYRCASSFKDVAAGNHDDGGVRRSDIEDQRSRTSTLEANPKMRHRGGGGSGSSGVSSGGSSLLSSSRRLGCEFRSQHT